MSVGSSAINGTAGPGSVSIWLSEVRQGCDTAAREIFNRYFSSLIFSARAELRGFQTRIVDEEDFALQTLEEACRGFQSGRFDSTNDRGHLWGLLLRMLREHIIDHKRWETRDRRSIDRLEAGGINVDSPGAYDGVGDVDICDQQKYLFGILEDEELRKIAAAKLDGYSNAEIALQLGISVRSVQRKVKIIYERWSGELS